MISALFKRKSQLPLPPSTPSPKTRSLSLKYHTASPTLHAQKHLPKNPNKPDELPAFSFKDLEATKTVRYVLIGGLTVVGTMETIFYAKVLRRKMGWDSVESGKEG